MPRAEFVCKSVLKKQNEKFRLKTESSADTFRDRLRLRKEEHEKIFTTIPYLKRVFDIESPGKLEFQLAEFQLDQLVKRAEEAKNMKRKYPKNSLFYQNSLLNGH